MDFERLQQALAIKGTTVTISKGSIPDLARILESCYGGQDIVLSGAEPGVGDGVNDTVVRLGRSPFLSGPGLPVVARFKVASGAVQATLRYTLPLGWKFSHSFPNLPKVLDFRETVPEPMSVPLDDLQFDSASFVVASQPQRDEELEAQLESGINFVGKIPLQKQDPTGVTGAVKSAFSYRNDQLVIVGTIRLPRDADKLQPLQIPRQPWAEKEAPPGILLRADLKIARDSSLASKLKFGDVWLRIYSPTSNDWLEANSTYAPVLAYTGTLGLPKAGIQASMAAFQELGGNELLLSGRFTGVSIQNLASLVDIGGDNDLAASMGVLNEAVAAFKKLELKSASLDISMRKKGGAEVTSGSVAVSMPLNWPVFSDQLLIKNVGALIDIDDPFNTRSTDPLSQFRRPKCVDVTLMGSLEIFDTPFDFTATTRDPFTLNARLWPGKTIPLTSLFKKYPNCVPSLGPEVAIDYLALTARYSQADSTYTFAGRVKGERLEIVEGLALSEVGVYLEATNKKAAGSTSVDGAVEAVFNIAGVDVALKTEKEGSNWRFIGRTGPSQKIHFGALIKQFLSADASVPSTIESLVLLNLAAAVSLDTGNESETVRTGAFRFEAEGQIEWLKPFGVDGEFKCKTVVKLERAAKNPSAAAPPVICDVEIDGGGQLKINDKNLTAHLNVHIQNGSGDQKTDFKITAGGSLSIVLPQGEFSFGLTFRTDADSQRITASWPAKNGANNLQLDFKELATYFGMDMTQVPDALVPTLTGVTFDYDFKTSQLLLAVRTTQTKLVFLTSPKSKQDKKRIYALILKVEARVMLSGLPMVGASLASFGDMGVDGFLAAVTSDELGEEISLFNQLIKDSSDTLPTLPLPAEKGKKLPKGVVIELNVLAGDAPRSLMFYLSSPPVKPHSPGPLLEGNLRGAGLGPLEATPQPARTGEAWLDVERSFGPVSIKRIGAAYDNGNIVLLLDAGFVVSALTLDLLGLSIGFPIKDFAVSKIRPGLDGMSLAYQSGPLAITGGFVNVKPAPEGLNYQYNGELLIQAKGFGLSAIGSFAEFSTQGREKSLFLFGVLNATLGGPAFFVITGIAAGFGYNRSLTLPTLDALPKFPLVAAATGTSKDLAKAQEKQDSVGALKMMDQYVYVALGESWLAVGIRFTSFKILDSFALLTVSFGNRFEIALLGLSSLTMPPLAPQDDAVGFAQLAIIASYAPDEGVLKVAAQLTPGSYILSKKCHLTGGFAFYSWFKDELDKSGALVKDGFRAGDFVVSLGGYHQNFKTPSYYPIVPRVGANWQIGSLTIKGGLYFALTPVAVMAGGALDANFESGSFKAWFIARIDFLLYWEPFYYLASASLSLGASYTLGSGTTAWTITIHVGVDLTLHGPPFGGKAVVNLYVFSVTIPFGTSDLPPDPLKWSEFKQRYLEQDKAPSPLNRVALGANQPDGVASQGDSICFSRVSSGLIKELPKGNPAGIDWIVNPEKFEIVTASKIPCSEAYLKQKVSSGPEDKKRLGGSEISKQFGVTPCGIDNGSLTSTHTITWTTDDGGPVIWTCPKDKDHILPAVASRLPRAAWFKDAATDVKKPPSVEMINKERVTDELTTGFTLKPMVSTPEATLPIGVEKLEVKITKKKSQPWALPTIPATDDWPKHDDPAGRLKVLEQVDTVTRRDRIAAALSRQNIAVAADSDARYLAEAAKRNELLAAPVLCHLGEPKR